MKKTINNSAFLPTYGLDVSKSDLKHANELEDWRNLSKPDPFAIFRNGNDKLNGNYSKSY